MSQSKGFTWNDGRKGIWIPRHIWMDPRLSLIEKTLLSEIERLEDKTRGCFASNRFFQVELFRGQSSVTNISRVINSLKKKKYVRTEQRIISNEKSVYTERAIFVIPHTENCSPTRKSSIPPTVFDVPPRGNGKQNIKSNLKVNNTPAALENIGKTNKDLADLLKIWNKKTQPGGAHE